MQPHFVYWCLAQIEPLRDADPRTEGWFFYLFFGSVVALLGFLFLANSFFRGFATKKELSSAIDRVDSDLKHLDKRNEELARAIFGEIKSMNTSMNHEFSSLNRSVGCLEGHNEMAKSIVEAIRGK